LCTKNSSVLNVDGGQVPPRDLVPMEEEEEKKKKD
jgi:hypothetical protein